jgi:ketosteroid isomerase-like protein
MPAFRDIKGGIMPSADISFSKYQITEDCNVVLHHRQLHAEGTGSHGQKSKHQPS